MIRQAFGVLWRFSSKWGAESQTPELLEPLGVSWGDLGSRTIYVMWETTPGKPLVWACL